MKWVFLEVEGGGQGSCEVEARIYLQARAGFSARLADQSRA
jgi:hypothetical protein